MLLLCWMDGIWWVVWWKQKSCIWVGKKRRDGFIDPLCCSVLLLFVLLCTLSTLRCSSPHFNSSHGPGGDALAQIWPMLTFCQTPAYLLLSFFCTLDGYEMNRNCVSVCLLLLLRLRYGWSYGETNKKIMIIMKDKDRMVWQCDSLFFFSLASFCWDSTAVA